MKRGQKVWAKADGEHMTRAGRVVELHTPDLVGVLWHDGVRNEAVRDLTTTPPKDRKVVEERLEVAAAKANVRDACHVACVEVRATLAKGAVASREAVARCMAAIAALDLETL